MMLKETGLKALHCERPLGCFGLRIDRPGYPNLFRFANFYMSPGGLLIAFGTPGIREQIEPIDLADLFQKHGSLRVEGYSAQLLPHMGRLHWAVEVKAQSGEIAAHICAADAFWLTSFGLQISAGTNGAALHFQPRCKSIEGGFNFAPNDARWCEYVPISERLALSEDLL